MQLNILSKDVGTLKVIAAKKNSDFFNVGQTEIIESSIDAVINWDQIV